jgi:pSer/pThr/pTyr-binding forkhead associated (FHA) protein
MKISIQIELTKTVDLETKKESVIVGRSPESDLIVSHPSISRKHCQVEVIDNTLFITDLNSSNGTFLNGMRLVSGEKHIIKSGDKLVIGKLDSQVSNTDPAQFTSSKINAPKTGSNTLTVNVNNIGLSIADVNLDVDHKVPKVKGPRNPVAEEYKLKRKPNHNTRNIYIILFGVVSVIVGILMFIGLSK